MKKKNLMLLPALAILLLGCSTPIASSETPSSGDVPTSSEHPSSSDVPSSDFPSSSDAPIAYDNGALAEFISTQALKYDPDSTSSFILQEAMRLDPSFSSEAAPTNASFLLLSYASFAKTMPSRRGARKFEFYENPSNPSLTGYEETSPYTDAFRFWSAVGIIDATSFDPTAAVDEALAYTYLDRIHYYYGSSPVDDFFAYANFDQRISDCPIQDGSSSDASISHVNVASDGGIYDWTKERIIEDHDAYVYYHAATSVGNSNLLSPMIEEYMAATSASGLLELLIDGHNKYGFSPLYDICQSSFGISPYGYWEGQKHYMTFFLPTWDASSTSIASGTEAYTATIDQYEPLFSYLLGDEAEGATRAKDYADFLYQVTLSCEQYRPDYMILYPFADYDIAKTGKTFENLLNEIGFTNTTFLYCSLVNYKGFFDLFTDEHLEELKAYVLYGLLKHYVTVLPDTEIFNEFIGYPDRNNDEAFYNKYILPAIRGNIINQYAGTSEYQDDVSTIRGLYVELEEEMGEKINAASWLSSEGKDVLLDKLTSINTLIGVTYYDDASSETIALHENAYGSLGNEADALTCQILYDSGEWEYSISILGTLLKNDFVDSCTNPATLMAANAYYKREYNDIQVTIAFMACNPDASKMSEEHLLGSYGVTLGHEIGHGFDASGFNYSKEGKVDETLMSETDRKAFGELTSRYSDYMTGYEVMPGLATDGAHVLDESVADNIGLSLSLTLGEKRDSFDASIYFRELAKVYGGYESRAFYQSAYAMDTHPIQRVRINRLFSSCDAFYAAYNVKEGDFMYVAPEERIKFY